MEDLDLDFQDLENLDDLLVGKIVGELVGPTRRKSTKATKEPTIINFEELAEGESVVVERNEFGNMLVICSILPSVNESASFIGFNVQDDVLHAYCTNLAEVVRVSVPIRNKTNKMENGFFALPMDTLIKAFRASNSGAVTIMKQDDEYRLSVTGGSIPIDNNALLNLDIYESALHIDDAEETTLDVSIYNGVTKSLMSLANTALSAVQKKVVLGNGKATSNFLRCLAEKSIQSDVELDIRVIDDRIIKKMVNGVTGLRAITIRQNNQKLLFDTGSCTYVSVKTKTFMSPLLPETMIEVKNNGIKFEVDPNEVSTITGLLMSLKGVSDNITLADKDGSIELSTTINGVKNSFETNAIKIGEGTLGEELTLSNHMFNSSISSYDEDKVVILLSEYGCIIESSDKTILVGAELS